jgi:hypothetical protein
MKKARRIVLWFLSFVLGTGGLFSCSDYLDVVPDNTVILEDYFSNKQKAYQPLARVYWYLVGQYAYFASPYMFGDDWLEGQAWAKNSAGIGPIMVMKGLLNEQSPPVDRWGHDYQGIQVAHTFLEHIGSVPDMAAEEKAEWAAQVKFLKANLYFDLLQQYGPFIIVDKNIPLDAKPEEMYLQRSKLDDCFDYIIRLMDEAMPDLKDRVTDNDLGQVDKMAALAIKARVMLFRASPFYNGNKQMYADFLDYDGQPFFPMDEKPEKWNDALKAVNEAIAFCERQGKGLYHYEDMPYPYDMDDYEANPLLKTYYDLRMLIVDPWNKELIWGRTVPIGDEGAAIQGKTGILQLEGGSVVESESSYAFAENWLGASYQAMERYYTKNGLPISDDRTFDRSTMFDIVLTPDTFEWAPGGPDYEGYAPLKGIMQPGVQTVNMYLNREPRFYANLGITGGYWRQHTARLETMMFGGTPGGWYSARTQDNWFWAGIGVKKFVHPESKSGLWQRQMKLVYPIIRMADLYLMKAEILNEIQGPGQAVWDEINKIRRRAGIPDVEKVWSDPETVSELSLNAHLDKNRMRDIILYERSIEFAFEGSRFFDMYRYKRATAEFNSPIMGWKGNAFGATDFFKIELKTVRRFTSKDYLFPLTIGNLNVNAKLIQNPGWRR